MTESEIASDGELNPLRLEIVPSTEPAPFRDHDFVAHCIGWIAIGGAIYPPVAAFLVALVYAPTNLTPILIGALCWSVIGFLIAAIVGAIAITLIWCINAMLNAPFSREQCAVAAGGLTGYVPTTIPLCEWISFGGTSAVIPILLGPVLATSIISIVVYRFTQKRKKRRLNPLPQPKFQITIRHLLVVTAISAVALAIAQPLGGMIFVIFVVGWMALQLLLAAIASAATRLNTPFAK